VDGKPYTCEKFSECPTGNKVRHSVELAEARQKMRDQSHIGSPTQELSTLSAAVCPLYSFSLNHLETQG
jgi:hypothetical protein